MFELDFDAIARVLKEQPAVEELQKRAAQTVNEAHQGPRASHEGKHDVDKIAVGDTHSDEAGAVVDIDWANSFWHIVEFGSAKNPPYAPIRRGAQNAGLRIIDKRGGGR